MTLLFTINDRKIRLIGVCMSQIVSSPKISLEQWSAFIAVVEEGSFARAAEALNKSQSAVSYAIARLNEQLPTPVLHAQGRKAALTEAGEVMFRRAKQLLNLAADVEQTAHCLAQGWEAQITLAVDAIVPVDKVLAAMHAFGEEVPQTRVVLLETTLSGTDEALIERRTDLALTARIPPGFLADPVGDVEMLAVAHPDHALAKAERELTEQDLRQARQIVVRDSGIKRSQDKGWLQAEQRFTVSHFATSLKALEQGLGFAFVPQPLISEALELGRLKRLKLAVSSERRVPLYMISASPDYVGPATRVFAKLLKAQFLKPE